MDEQARLVKQYSIKLAKRLQEENAVYIDSSKYTDLVLDILAALSEYEGMAPAMPLISYLKQLLHQAKWGQQIKDPDFADITIDLSTLGII